MDYDRPVPKTAGTSEAQAIATELNQRGIDNVNLLLAPVFWLQMLQASGAQAYRPQWVGAGIQFTVDAIASAGCGSGSLEGAKMFSPFPAWIDSDTGLVIKVYTLDGQFSGRQVGKGIFTAQAEGIALYACENGSGYWLSRACKHFLSPTLRAIYACSEILIVIHVPETYLWSRL